jgi:hypothetical protein
MGRPPTGPVPGSGVYPFPQPPAGPPLSYTPVPGGSQAMSASDLDAPRKGGKLALIFAVVAILAVAGAVAAFIIVDKQGEEPKGNGAQGVVPAATDAGAVAAAAPDAGAVAAAAPDAAPVAAVFDAGAVAAVTPDAAIVPDVPVKSEPVIVLVNGSAQGADIFENGKKIGRSPQMVKVVPGETRSLTLKARGYKDATVDVDGTREEVAVRMERVGGGKPDPKPDTRPDPRPDPKPQTAQERLRELCRKNPSDDRCLMLDD